MSIKLVHKLLGHPRLGFAFTVIGTAAFFAGCAEEKKSPPKSSDTVQTLTTTSGTWYYDEATGKYTKTDPRQAAVAPPPKARETVARSQAAVVRQPRPIAATQAAFVAVHSFRIALGSIRVEWHLLGHKPFAEEGLAR